MVKTKAPKINWGVIITGLLISVSLTCTKITDPYTDSSNVRVQLLLDDSDNTFTIGDTLIFEIPLYLANLVSSVSVNLGNLWDTTYVHISSSHNDTLTGSIVLSSTGTYNLVAEAFVNNNESKRVSATITINGRAPLIIEDIPGTLTRNEGVACTLSVRTEPADSITAVWKHDTTVIAGKVTPTLIIPSLTPGDAGSYHCIVTNTWGSDTSSACVLLVQAANAPLSPTGLTIVTRSATVFSFNWSAVASATTYKIYRSSSTVFPSGTSPYSSVSTTQFSDTAAGTFYYWVTSYNSNGESTPSAMLYGGIANQPPGWERNLFTISIAEGADTSLHLNAIVSDPNADALSFVLHRSANSPSTLAAHDSIVTISAGRRSAGLYQDTVFVSDSALSDTLIYSLQINATSTHISVTTLNGTVSFSSDTSKLRWGDTISLTATANNGFVFDSWLGQGTGNSTNTTLAIVMNSNKVVTANFVSQSISDCWPVKNTSIRATITEIVSSAQKQGTICPVDNQAYDNGAMVCKGMVRIKIRK